MGFEARAIALFPTKADEASNELEQLDKKMSDLSARMLFGVAMNYGKSSSEYEMAGGVR